MDAYFDSAIIVKLYVKEMTSPDTIRLVGKYMAPYALTQWQALDPDPRGHILTLPP